MLGAAIMRGVAGQFLSLVVFYLVRTASSTSIIWSLCMLICSLTLCSFSDFLELLSSNIPVLWSGVSSFSFLSDPPWLQATSQWLLFFEQLLRLKILLRLGGQNIVISWYIKGQLGVLGWDVIVFSYFRDNIQDNICVILDNIKW